MGSTQARDIAQDVKDAGLTMANALALHLYANHYPPVSSVFIDIAVEAIEKANAGEFWFVQTYPNGLKRTVRQTFAGLHLEAFIEPQVMSVHEEAQP